MIQVEWYDVSTNEELRIKDELMKTKPSQVKLVPMIKREDMARYYNYSDAVLGNMRIGTYALIELEGIIIRGKYTLEINWLLATKLVLESCTAVAKNCQGNIAAYTIIA